MSSRRIAQTSRLAVEHSTILLYALHGILLPSATGRALRLQRGGVVGWAVWCLPLTVQFTSYPHRVEVFQVPRRTAEQATARWLRGMQGASQNYQEGVASVTQAPGAAAVRNQAGYVNGVQAAVANGKWARNTGAVSLQSWQEATLSKGAARLAAGAAAAEGKVLAAQQKIGAMVDRAQQAIANMPRDTPENRIARSQAFLMNMRQQANGSRR